MPEPVSDKLPVHGFVLAGGKSSRMGTDKALLEFRGRPLVEIAVEKLRTFCVTTSICGNRDDLSAFAPVVREERKDVGPAAGIEAGLRCCSQPWALFTPVDVPLVPADLLHRWAQEAIQVNRTVSFLAVWHKQPAFCLLRRERAASLSAGLDAGERRLEALLHRTADADGYVSWAYDPYDLYGFPEYAGPDEATLELWFRNLNTPEDLAEARRAAPPGHVAG